MSYTTVVQYCNHAIDHCKTFQEVFSPELPERFNLLIRSDGGARASCGASAWIAEAVFWKEDAGRWERRKLDFAGAYFGCSVSSFDAEALALYHATSFIKAMIRKLPSTS